MSGHSHWAGIKHKKEVTDQKRGKAFSKLLALISATAKIEPNPDFNPRLRTTIIKAKDAGVPQDNVERAIKRASEAGVNLEELIFESYGPGGSAILIEAVSDNKNRTVQEIKLILKEHNGKWAETGSVQWAFESNAEQRELDADKRGDDGDTGWHAKFPQDISNIERSSLMALIEALEANDSVQNIYTTANLEN